MKLRLPSQLYKSLLLVLGIYTFSGSAFAVAQNIDGKGGIDEERQSGETNQMLAAGDLNITQDGTIDASEIIGGMLTTANGVSLIINGSVGKEVVISGNTKIANVSSNGTGRLEATGTIFNGGLVTGGGTGSTNETFVTISLKDSVVKGAVKLYGSSKGLAVDGSGNWASTSLKMAGGYFDATSVEINQNAAIVLSGVSNSEEFVISNIKLNSVQSSLSLEDGTELKVDKIASINSGGNGSLVVKNSSLTANVVELYSSADIPTAEFTIDHSRLNVLTGGLLLRGHKVVFQNSEISVNGNMDLYSGIYHFSESVIETTNGFFRLLDESTTGLIEDSTFKVGGEFNVSKGAHLTIQGESTVDVASWVDVASTEKQSAILELKGAGVSFSGKKLIINNTGKKKSILNIEGSKMSFSDSATLDGVIIKITEKGSFTAKSINVRFSSELSMDEGTTMTSSESLILACYSDGGYMNLNGATLISTNGSLKLTSANKESCFLTETTLIGKNIYIGGYRDMEVEFSSVYLTTTGGVFEVGGGVRLIFNEKTTGQFTQTYIHDRGIFTIEADAQVSLGDLTIGPDATDDWPRYGRLIIDENRDTTSGKLNVIYGPTYDKPNGPVPDLKSALIIRNGGLLTMGESGYPVAENVSLSVRGSGTTLLVQEGAFIETDSLMSVSGGAVVTLDKTAETKINGVMLSDSGTSLMLNDSTGISLGTVAVGNGATLELNGTILESGSLDVLEGGTAYLGTTSGTLSEDGLLSLSTVSALASPDMLKTETGARIGTSISNMAEEAPVWHINMEDLRISMDEAFGAHDISMYAYRIFGKVTVSNVDIKLGEKIEAGAGSIVDLGENPLQGEMILSGGTIDVSRTGTDLGDDKISGSSGMLVTSGGQTLYLDMAQVVGYSVHGKDGASGANIVVGSASASDSEVAGPAIVLAGEKYHTDSVTVMNGTVVIDGRTVVGSGNDGAQLTVGDADLGSKAMLVNNGTVNNMVTVHEGSALKGTGIFIQKATMNANTTLVVGNSSGFQNYKGGLDLNGTEVLFTLDGLQAATLENTGEGTYSHILVEGGTSTWTGTQNFVLTIGKGLMRNEGVAFNLELLHFTDPSSVNRENSLITSELNGLIDLVEQDSIRIDWNSDNSALVLSGVLNARKVQEILTPDSARLANTMWSSTRSVAHFAGTAVSRLDSPRGGQSNYWVSGLGDFSSVSGSGSVSGFDYNGGGYAVGADHAFSGKFTAGLAFGQTFGTNKATDLSYASTDQNGVMGAVYARFQNEINKSNSWGVDGYMAYGSVENRTTMALDGADDSLYRGKWMDNVVTLGLKAHWDIKLDARNTLTPFVGIDFLHGDQKDVSLYSDSEYERFYNGGMQTWTVPVGVTYKTLVSLGGPQYLIPEVTVAYAGDVSRSNPSVSRDILGQRVTTEGVNTGRNAFIGNAGLTWVITQNWNFGVRYNLECRRDMTNQAVNGTVSYSF